MISKIIRKFNTRIFAAFLVLTVVGGASLILIMISPSCAPSPASSTTPGGTADSSCNIFPVSGSPNASFNSVGIFSVPPIPIAAIQGIQPLGNLISPGHTYPSDHIYFNMKNSAQNANQIVAAAAGTIVAITSSRNDNLNYRIYVQVDPSFQYFYDHVTPANGIAVGQSVNAGTVVGTNSGTSVAFDFGVLNFNQASYPGILNSCIQTAEKNVDAPLKYFSGQNKTDLYNLVTTTNANKDGTIGFDVAGKLIGDWTQQGVSNAMQAQTQQLTLAYDTKTVNSMHISSGGTVLPVGDYGVSMGDPDFATVSQGSGLVTYHITNYGQVPVIGTMLVQMTGPSQIKIEYFAGANPGAFDGNALTYVR